MKSKDKLILKICGMREENNIMEISYLNPDFMGFIFYKSSPRNAFGIKKEIIGNLRQAIQAVGVFVDSPLQEILFISEFYNINWIQLHGKESPEFCKKLKQKGFKIIKAIRFGNDIANSCFPDLEKYIGNIDFFLFDTAGKSPGGNGIKFNWGMLEDYPFDTPYLLSGGIGPEDVEDIKLKLPKKCVGIDINSKFEMSPGLKDLDLLTTFLNKIRN